MRRAFAILALALTVATPVQAKPKRDPAVTRGHEVARQACAACHAVDPGKSSPVPKAPPFASREMQHVAGLEGRLAGLTGGGHYGMPPQTLTDQQVRDLLAYIVSLEAR